MPLDLVPVCSKTTHIHDTHTHTRNSKASSISISFIRTGNSQDNYKKKKQIRIITSMSRFVSPAQTKHCDCDLELGVELLIGAGSGWLLARLHYEVDRSVHEMQVLGIQCIGWDGMGCFACPTIPVLGTSVACGKAKANAKANALSSLPTFVKFRKRLVLRGCRRGHGTWSAMQCNETMQRSK